MTPGRLSQIRCPQCTTPHWIIDSDHRGGWEPGRVYEDVPYEGRTYTCPCCSYSGPTYVVVQQAPIEFLLREDPDHPIVDRAHWMAILRREFPDYPVSLLVGPRRASDVLGR